MPVTVNTDLPLHPERDTSWDGDAARAAMAQACAAEDGVNADCMGRGFVWRDGDADPATIGAYALPVANVFGGDLHLVLSGAQAAANAVSPEREAGGPRAMGGTEAELGQMRTAIAAILRRFATEFDDEGLRAPWDRPESEAETAAAGPGCGCNCGGASAEPPINKPEPPKEAAMPVPTTTAPRSRVLRASATGGEWRPPADHFANPRLSEPTKLTVTADGRVYGHLATWDQPHIGYDGKLVYPPKSSDGTYGYFRQSKVMTASGDLVPVGIVTMNTGHAAENLSADAAAAHYDNTGTMVAAVNVGEDAIGIWVAGSMLPDVSPELRTRFSLARVSGDWRQPRPGAGLELIAALSVPNPGFPVQQPRALLEADRMALAAAGYPQYPGFQPNRNMPPYGVVTVDDGEIRTFITAGATVVDEAQDAAMAKAVREAMTAELMEPMKAMIGEAVGIAVREALTAQQSAAVDGVETTPVTEGEPAATGEADAAPVPADITAETPADTETATEGATDAGAGAALPAEAASPAAAAPAPVPQGQVAASALAQRLMQHRSKDARKRLLVAAARSKKA
jgi:hypothetical protein